jgi:hypothetical protein
MTGLARAPQLRPVPERDSSPADIALRAPLKTLSVVLVWLRFSRPSSFAIRGGNGWLASPNPQQLR